MNRDELIENAVGAAILAAQLKDAASKLASNNPLRTAYMIAGNSAESLALSLKAISNKD